jgi:hypothetical protein
MDRAAAIRRLLRRQLTRRKVSDLDPDAFLEELVGQAIASGADPEKVYDAVGRSVIDSGTVLADELQRRTPRMVREHDRIARRFERNLRKRWKAALDLYYAVYVACLELGEQSSRKRKSRNESSYRLEALVRLHVRACLVASEVHALLRTGHANGAMARARTLHEHAVTAFVLSKAGEEDAERAAAVDDRDRGSSPVPPGIHERDTHARVHAKVHGRSLNERASDLRATCDDRRRLRHEHPRLSRLQIDAGTIVDRSRKPAGRSCCSPATRASADDERSRATAALDTDERRIRVSHPLRLADRKRQQMSAAHLRFGSALRSASLRGRSAGDGEKRERGHE